MVPPKSIDGVPYMALSPSMKIIVGVAGSLLTLAGALCIWLVLDIREKTEENGRKLDASNTEMRILQVRFETRDNDMVAMRKRVEDIEEKTQKHKAHVDHHVGSEGHVIAIRRDDRLEADIQEIKKRLK